MILQAKNISKRYGNHLVVDHIHLQFEKGTFNAILGPNGAGKSTTISMLIGLKQPTQGAIIYEPGTKIGVVFQTSVLDEMLTVRENLTIRARQYKGLKPNRVSDLIDRLGLSAFQKQKYGTLSGGQKRRVDIARALLHGPDLLFLDEPTTGLDIQTRKSIWDLLYQLQREEGMTVVLTTHYLDEASREIGRAVQQECQYATNILKIRFKERQQIESLKSSGMSVEQQSQLEYVLRPESEREAIDYLAQVRDKIAHFEFRPGTMDDAFIALTGREVR